MYYMLIVPELFLQHKESACFWFFHVTMQRIFALKRHYNNSVAFTCLLETIQEVQSEEMPSFPLVSFGMNTRTLLLSDLSGIMISVGDWFSHWGFSATAYVSPVQENSAGTSYGTVTLWLMHLVHRILYQSLIASENPLKQYDPLLWPCIVIPLPLYVPVSWLV